MDSNAADRFAQSLKRVWPEGSAAGCDSKLGLAVSGGPDSLALLLLARAVLPGRIEVATVDHRLRAGSAAEARDVAELCAEIGVPHAVLEVEVAPGNIQAEARVARYQAMSGWLEQRALAALATAHHADDQAETLILRLNRASGVAGLAGTRARGAAHGSRHLLVRPLLDWRRAELAQVVARAGLVAATDPSNTDDRFDRARLRGAMVDAAWLDVAAVAQSAAHLADADTALDWAAQREWTECVMQHGTGLTYRPSAPRAIALRVVTRIVAQLDGQEPRGGAAARLFDALVARQTSSIGNLVARATHEGWTFTRAPTRRVRPEPSGFDE